MDAITTDKIDTKKTIIFYREKFNHMGSNSGYDRLFTELNNIHKGIVIPADTFTRAQSKLSKLTNKLTETIKIKQSRENNDYLLPHHRELVCETIVKKMMIDPECVAILSFGDTQYGNIFSNAGRDIKKRIIICNHNPPAWFKLNSRPPNLYQDLKGIICLGRNQKNYFDLTPNSKAHFIKHGVDTDFFKPRARKEFGEHYNLLSVGEYLRDFNCLRFSMHKIWKKLPKTQLHCVVPPRGQSNEALFALASDPRVHIYSKIPSRELALLYEQSDLLFMPLFDAVANNAIVEASSCGLPIVTSNVGSVSDYTLPSFSRLCPQGDAAGHANAVIDTIEDAQFRESAPTAARLFAEQELNWNRIAVDILDIALNRSQSGTE